jgi:hypothetical protein
MVERVCRRGRAQRVSADLDPQRGRICSHHLVHRVRRDRLESGVAAVAMNRSKQSTGVVRAMPGGF